MPLACNLQSQYFSFGEYIIKEGEVPKGLYIIKSGQCKVASVRISDREFKENFELNKKLGKVGHRKKNNNKGNIGKIAIKIHPLLVDYDPENSLLNV